MREKMLGFLSKAPLKPQETSGTSVRSFEFELVFSLPRDAAVDELDLINSIYEAGFEDAVVGTGSEGLVAVSLDEQAASAELAILRSVARLRKALPVGTELREVRPDLVSLGDIAARLRVARQALQKRHFRPSVAGLYRLTEIASELTSQKTGKIAENIVAARPWLEASEGAKVINAQIALGRLEERIEEAVKQGA